LRDELEDKSDSQVVYKKQKESLKNSSQASAEQTPKVSADDKNKKFMH
jgi:hypothetical protein